MKRVLIHVLVAYCLLLCACSAIERKPPKQTTKVPQYPHTTYIISDPPGAKIEINQEYVGDTPFSVQIEAKTSWIGGEVSEDLRIVAYPTGDGQYMQTKNLKGVKVPKRIYFDLHLKPLPDQEINVNVNP